MSKFGLIAGALLAGVAMATAPARAQTVTYDYAGNYGSSAFTYGYGTTGTTFTPFTASFPSGCLGSANLACKTANGSSDLPAVGITTNPMLAAFYTNIVAPGTLFVQPGFAATGEDAIVNFVAPIAGNYTFAGTIGRIDTTANGNGVTVSTYFNGTFQSSNALAAVPGAGTPLSFTSFFNQGDKFTIGVSSNGNTSFDGTGITAAAIGPVPEPATWAMMLMGFGMVGFGLRYRRKGRTAKVIFS